MEVLPDDLVRKCLLGVPYTSHDNLKAVCKSWEGIVNRPQFYGDRKISGKSEQLICFIQRVPKAVANNSQRFQGPFVFAISIYDPVNGTWRKLPPIDDPHFTGLSSLSQCVAVNGKLVLLTGAYTMKREQDKRSPNRPDSPESGRSILL